MARHGRLMGEYRDAFVRDLDPASSGWPGSLGELSGRLKAWRATLQSTVEDSMPPYLRLEDEARSLQVGIADQSSADRAFSSVHVPDKSSS
jgi:transformation/transcription domain-associated protein